MRYRVVIELISPKQVIGIISSITRRENEPAAFVTLAHGICRPARMDFIVEKGTELGVSSFIFFYSEKSYKPNKNDDSDYRKIHRLERLVQASAKQSLRSLIPSVTFSNSVDSIFSIIKDYDQCYVAAIRPDSKRLAAYLNQVSTVKKFLLLVGPESGLTIEETEQAIKAGFHPVSLGPRRLRTETAGIVFPAILLNLLGEI